MTPAEVASRECWLLSWELVAIAATLIVLMGVFGEHVNDHGFWKWKATKDPRREKRSSSLLIFGLALELVSLIFTTVLAGTLIGDLKLKTAEANERAAKLDTRVGWRQVGGPQYHTLVAQLREYEGQHAVMLWDNQESHIKSFASQLHDLLQDGRWRVPVRLPEGERQTVQCDDDTGVVVATSEPKLAGQKVADAANTLLWGLRADMREATLRTDGPPATPERIVILICPPR